MKSFSHCLAFALVVGCSVAPSTSVGSAAGVVGSRGGTVSLGDDATISVPPGALMADQTITITRSEERAPAGYVAY